jgi:ABC-type nitrate/sulfonate/bicarbonate transport system substrate-binding protein
VPLGRTVTIPAGIWWEDDDAYPQLFGAAAFRGNDLAASILVTSIVAAGCSSGTGSAALTSVAAAPDITVVAIPAVDLAGLYIAQDRGLFARQGLHGDDRAGAQQPVGDQPATGRPGGYQRGSYVAYLAAQVAGARFRILAEASTLSPDTRALVVTANSRITTVGQLAGRKIGVNGGEQHWHLAGGRVAVRARGDDAPPPRARAVPGGGPADR